MADEKPDIHSFVCDALGIKYEVNDEERNDMAKFKMKHSDPPELWHPCKDVDIGKMYTTQQL